MVECLSPFLLGPISVFSRSSPCSPNHLRLQAPEANHTTLPPGGPPADGGPSPLLPPIHQTPTLTRPPPKSPYPCPYLAPSRQCSTLRRIHACHAPQAPGPMAIGPYCVPRSSALLFPRPPSSLFVAFAAPSAVFSLHFPSPSPSDPVCICLRLRLRLSPPSPDSDLCSSHQHNLQRQQQSSLSLRPACLLSPHCDLRPSTSTFLASFLPALPSPTAHPTSSIVAADH